MRKQGLTAAALLAAILFAFSACGAMAGKGEARGAVEHTCSAPDKQFIRAAGINMLAVNTSGRDYLAGTARAKDVVRDARRAALIVENTHPTDSSLLQTRTLLRVMFTEYGLAIQARAKGRDSAPHMLKAYEFANHANEVLVAAAPDLHEAGCDVSALF